MIAIPSTGYPNSPDYSQAGVERRETPAHSARLLRAAVQDAFTGTAGDEGFVTTMTHPAKRKCRGIRIWATLLTGIGVLFSGCAAAADSVTARSGERTFIGMAMAIDKSCTSATATFIYPETPGYPAHGQISYKLAEGRFKKNTSDVCAGKTTRGVAVIYRSDPGFVGTDRVTVRTFDHSEHVINITVVKQSSPLARSSKLRGL